MRMLATLALVGVALAVPAQAELTEPLPDDNYVQGAPQQPYVAIDEGQLPYGAGGGVDDASVDYVPGIEAPRGGKAVKQITDQVE